MRQSPTSSPNCKTQIRNTVGAVAVVILIIIAVSSVAQISGSNETESSVCRALRETPAASKAIDETGVMEANSSEGNKGALGRCVSIAYNKPAKTGSTTVGQVLSHFFEEGKSVNCGLHNVQTSLSKLMLPENEGFDIFHCHSSWNATMLSAIVHQAKHPIVHLTTIRDPVEQLISLFFHVEGERVCGSGNVPTESEMLEFVRDVFNPRVPAFYSRPYQESDLSRKLAEEECAYWDVIWRTDQLTEALGSDWNLNTLEKRSSCPEKQSMLANTELMDALHEATARSREMYEGMKDCEKVRNEVPWEWDPVRECIAEKI